MIESAIHNKFDASAVPLKGSNLIEASAGTGKTYSIAILVLRLILEQGLSVKEILMVTFTRAAVAELESRIREFIRLAYKVSMGNEISDEKIMSLVLEVIDPENPQAVQQRLRDAILLLDETSVLTIHGFCQQTLSEFAFETNQLFGAEMVPDMTPMIENEVNKFWRRHITTLHPELLQYIFNPDLKSALQDVVKNHLSGKKYFAGTEIDTELSSARQVEWIKGIHHILEKEEAATKALHESIIENSIHWESQCLNDRNAKKTFAPLIGKPPLLIEKIKEKRGTKYVEDLFFDIIGKIDEIDIIKKELSEYLLRITQHLYCFAIQTVEQSMLEFKSRSSTMGYDDLINNLHAALVKNDNEELAQSLQQKYKAVFVDEFQDTDKLQYEIFNRAFGKNTILFYIGDPKQSIYGFRKADIYTYFNAKKGVSELYDMNQNYRSAEGLILAMNRFFKPTPEFDTFCFEGEADSIDYIEVQSPQPNTKGALYFNGQEVTPIEIATFSNKDKIALAVASTVARLLSDNQYNIKTPKGARTVAPSDIGILVRTGDEGKLVKKALARVGVPAVTIDEAKILRSPEAQQLLHLLEAMEAPDRSSINRALLNSFTSFNSDTILQLDDELTLSLFNKYRNLWQKDGAYTAIMEFISDFDVRNQLLNNLSVQGERTITNLYQLAELVHQVQSRKNLSLRDLLTWLKRGIDGMATEGDEYIQRVESDEEAVNIVTIHKSKGLEYKIVFAPFLDLTVPSRSKFVNFRDPESGDYYYMEPDRLNEAQRANYERQQHQENRRLIYVAITRAIYKCYIYNNSAAAVNKSDLKGFVNTLKTNLPDSGLIAIREKEEEVPFIKYQPAGSAIAAPPPAQVNFSLQEENWRKMSYTMLAAKAAQQPKARTATTAEGYDNFIFNTLRRGAKTGNLLHFIFEHINFSDSSQWSHWLEEAIRHFVPGQRALYLEPLHEMLQHVMYAPIAVGGERFQLASIGRFQRLAEFEFDFPVPLFQTSKLNALSDDQAVIAVRYLYEHNRQELEGIMNGKIDLFFEHQGKFYVLDWKSNYLGGTLSDYEEQGLLTAMNENNYHLQYLIYTVAVKKYLENRLPGFDYNTQFGGVIYCFVRGVRNTGNTGIFTVRPSMEKIAALESILTK